MDKILEKWDEILSTVKHEHDISDISFDTWIRPLEVYGVEGSTLYILVPSEQMTLSYISKKYYLSAFSESAFFFGTPLLPVRIFFVCSGRMNLISYSVPVSSAIVTFKGR